MEVGLGPAHIALDGEPAPLPQKGSRAPQYSAHFYCGQTAGWMKTPLGTEVDLGPGHIVLEEVPALHEMGTAAPIFSASVCCGQMAGWIEIALGMEVGLSPGQILLDGNPAPLQKRGHSPLQFFVHVLWPNG